MTYHILLLLILCNYAHWMSDFFFQTDKMALNKSSKFEWLGLHCLVYSSPFWLIDWRFGLITLISHLVIDGITSRATSYFWKKEDRHNFFVTIGFDQLLHNIVIIITIYVLQAQIL
jgi:hypothetical protein